jgi:hypothetical protein
MAHTFSRILSWKMRPKKHQGHQQCLWVDSNHRLSRIYASIRPQILGASSLLLHEDVIASLWTGINVQTLGEFTVGQNLPFVNKYIHLMRQIKIVVCGINAWSPHLSPRILLYFCSINSTCQAHAPHKPPYVRHLVIWQTPISAKQFRSGSIFFYFFLMGGQDCCRQWAGEVGRQAGEGWDDGWDKVRQWAGKVGWCAGWGGMMRGGMMGQDDGWGHGSHGQLAYSSRGIYFTNECLFHKLVWNSFVEYL